MRTLDAALTTAQQATSREPYRRVHFDDRDSTTYTYTTRDATNRIVYLEQWEEPYAGVAIVRLKNHNGYFTAKDLRGYSVTIGWGFVLNSTPDSTWHSNAAPMKVRYQRDLSYEGELVTEFYCVGIWAEIEANTVLAAGKKLTGTVVNGDGFTLGEAITGSNSGATGKLTVIGSNFIIVTRVSGTFESSEDADGATASVDNLSAVSNNYGPLVYASGDTSTEARIESLTGLTVDVDEDDPDGSMADTPFLAVEAGTGVRAIIRSMLLRTKCGMRYENNTHLHALYLDTTDASQYDFDSSHAFLINMRERAVIMPNTVIFVDALPNTDGVAATYFGTANDATSVAAIGTFTTVIVDPDLASNEEAVTRAAAWIAQQVAEAYQGQIVAPMECGLEVYDMVQAVDSRLNVTAKGRIGRIERVYEPRLGTDEVRINLGSLYSVPGAMDVGPDSRDNDLRDLVSHLDKKPPTKRATVLPWQLFQAMQPYTCDIDFSVTDENTISWSSGTIYFADGTSLSIDASASQDLQAGAGWLYFTEGSATLTYTQTYADCVAPTHGLVALVAPATIETGKSGAKALIVPFAGKVGSFNADVITCIYLAALTVDALVATFGSGAVIANATGLVVDGEKIYFKDGATSVATIGANPGQSVLRINAASGKDIGLYGDEAVVQGQDGDAWVIANDDVRLSPGTDDDVRLAGEYLNIVNTSGEDFEVFSSYGDFVLDPASNDVVPGDTTQDLGDSTYYWDDINYSDLIDQTPSPHVIADAVNKIKAIGVHQSIKKRKGHPDMEIETFNKETFPEELLVRPVQRDYDRAEHHYYRQLRKVEHLEKFRKVLFNKLITSKPSQKVKIQGTIDSIDRRLERRGTPVMREPQLGSSMNATIGLLLSAVRELTTRIEELESR